MTSSRDDLVQVAFRHAAAEGVNDLAGTMATLEGEPVYELYPIGRTFAACKPFGPLVVSNSTFWPSAKLRKPLP